mmetsp:Transcript_92994/g.259061  ORF Transcript_92994/g.259061 Transcript_92994/m.259061 type:complete len:224 (-) Transcript_92994:78-749(-)
MKLLVADLLTPWVFPALLFLRPVCVRAFGLQGGLRAVGEAGHRQVRRHWAGRAAAGAASGRCSATTWRRQEGAGGSGGCAAALHALRWPGWLHGLWDLLLLAEDLVLVERPHGRLGQRANGRLRRRGQWLGGLAPISCARALGGDHRRGGGAAARPAASSRSRRGPLAEPDERGLGGGPLDTRHAFLNPAARCLAQSPLLPCVPAAGAGTRWSGELHGAAPAP